MNATAGFEPNVTAVAHHPHYISDGLFVWHKDSFDAMQSLWD
ncbi:hypothetical protein WMF04_23580 [Sorangium sp. So ce260]